MNGNFDHYDPTITITMLIIMIIMIIMVVYSTTFIYYICSIIFPPHFPLLDIIDVKASGPLDQG